jgi:hypothetical protein
MKTATVKLVSECPIAFSRYHETTKEEKELPKDYEARTWAEKAHCLPDGEVFIPPAALKNCLSEAAKFLSKQIPGKGKSTYTKHFEAGVLCLEGIKIGVKKDELEPYWIFCPASGIRGDSKRVNKCFPIIRQWSGIAVLHIVDAIITKDVFLEHIQGAGMFIGLGSFRVRNNGWFGRFSVEDLKWE